MFTYLIEDNDALRAISVRQLLSPPHLNSIRRTGILSAQARVFGDNIDGTNVITIVKGSP